MLAIGLVVIGAFCVSGAGELLVAIACVAFWGPVWVFITLRSVVSDIVSRFDRSYDRAALCRVELAIENDVIDADLENS